MKPIEFKEQNRILGKPENMTDEECSSLPVFSDGKDCISCWQFSDEEIEKIKQSKCIWVGVLSGYTQPPIFLTVDTPFVENKNNGKWKIYIIEDDGEITFVIAQDETEAINCYCEEIPESNAGSIREATMDEIKNTKIQSEEELKMPTLMDYHINYDGLKAEIICSTLYTD